MKKRRTILIDADVPCYHLAFKNQTNVDWDNDGEESIYTDPDAVVPDVNSYIDGLVRTLKGHDVVLALSHSHNYRKDLYPEYKANRKAPKPALWQMVRDYIENGDHGHTVKIKPNLEGDDVLGIMATHPRWKDNHVLVTIDKDLRTVPCNLFLYNHPENGVIPCTAWTGRRFLMSQVLTGDVTDNYKGCPGIGAVKAENILAKAEEDGEDYWSAIVRTYESKGLTEDDALLQARLAYILQYGDYNNKTGEVKLWEA